MLADAPVIKCSKLHVTAKLGGIVLFTCDVKANPSSSVTWLSGTNLSMAEPVDENSTRADEKVCTLYIIWWSAMIICHCAKSIFKIMKQAKV